MNYSVPKSIIDVLGPDKAIVYMHIVWLLENNSCHDCDLIKDENKLWVRVSLATLKKSHLPYWSLGKITKIFAELVRDGYFLRKHIPPAFVDFTMSYSIGKVLCEHKAA